MTPDVYTTLDRERIDVLDHGFVRLVETWGSDEQIIRSARMSTQKGFEGWGPKPVKATCMKCGPVPVEEIRLDTDDVHEYIHVDWRRPCGAPCDVENGPGDEKLLRYLYENKHSTPFEFAGATFEIQAPIVVFREWHRHRVPFGYSEMSARYAPLPDQHYTPTVERLLMVNTATKQATPIAGAEQLSMQSALEWLAELAVLYEHSERVYQSGLRRGVAKECARFATLVSRYSRMRATGNLRGWLNFLSLREPTNAQWEIRQFAEIVSKLLASKFPRTHALYVERRS